MNGEDARTTALRESFREAGVTGTLNTLPFFSDQGVLIFFLRISRVHENWPEKSARKRIFVDLGGFNLVKVSDWYKEIIKKAIEILKVSRVDEKLS